MTDQTCLAPQSGRRRIFWTTQPSCGTYPLCGVDCVIPGLVYEDSEEPTTLPNVPRTIANNDWLRSLVLNILNTRARTDLNCTTPAAVYGHWSESYAQNGLYIGSTLWNAAAKSYSRISDSVKAINAAIKADMSKLTIQKLADSVDVETVYSRGSTVAVTITVNLSNTRHVINLSGSIASDTWMWR
jgi:hypothetical protein